MTKDKQPKQTPQQVFNQFLFESMMERIRGAELIGQDIQRAHERHTHHINDHRANDLLPQFRQLCEKVEGMDINIRKIADTEYANKIILMTRIVELEESNSGLWEKVAGLEKTHNGICTQKSTEDWLNKLSEEQDKLQEQIKGLEHRLSRAQDDIADIHPSGCICGEKKEVTKNCETCKNQRTRGDYAPCRSCHNYIKWRPKKPVKAGKVQG